MTTKTKAKKRAVTKLEPTHILQPQPEDGVPYVDPPGWYIGLPRGYYWVTNSGPPLVFHNKKEVQLAIDSLARHGILTGKDLDALSNGELRSYAYEPWLGNDPPTHADATEWE